MCIRIRSFLCFSVLRFRFPSFGFQLDDDAAGAVRREEFQTCLHQVIAAYDAVVVLDTRKAEWALMIGLLQSHLK